MAFRLSGVGVGYLAGAAAFFIGLGIYTAYGSFGDRLNYSEVEATITGSAIECARLPDHPQYPGKIVHSACGDLADLSVAELGARHIVRSRTVRFSYTSPVDGRSHQGTYLASVSSRFDRPGDRIFAGKTGRVLASKNEASGYKVIPGGFGSTS